MGRGIYTGWPSSNYSMSASYGAYALTGEPVTLTQGGSSTYSQIISQGSGWSSTTGFTLNSGAALRGTAINPAYTTSGHQAGTIWYNTQVNLTGGFDTTFTFNFVPAGTLATQVGILQSGNNGAVQTMTFMIQNSSSATLGPTCPSSVYTGLGASADANMGGFGGYTTPSQCPIGASIALKFDLSPVNGPFSGGQIFPSVPSSLAHVGLYANYGPLGALTPTDDMVSTGLNFYSGNDFLGHITYDTSLLTLTVKDTVTGAQARKSWAINIPTVIGNNSAWVGFGAGVGIACAGQQNIKTWTFGTGNYSRLSTPSISVGTGQYSSTQTVTISGPSGATIYYTTNGNQPTNSDSVYSTALTISSDTILQAVAIESGYMDSLVAESYIQIRSGTTPTINLTSGLTSSFIKLAGSAIFSGSAVQLTDGSNSTVYYDQAGAAWFPVPVSIATFNSTFTFTQSGTGQGLTFCMQNVDTPDNSTYQWVSGGPTCVANGAGSLGYSGGTGMNGQNTGLKTSAAVKFDIYVGNVTGLLLNAALPTSTNVSIGGSVTLNSGHVMLATMAYNGTTLNLTIEDTVTTNSWSTSWTVNLPSAVGASTAYVGFTASTGGAVATQKILTFTFGP